MKHFRNISKQFYFHKKERRAILLILLSLIIIYGLEFYLTETRYDEDNELVSRISYDQNSSLKVQSTRKSDQFRNKKKQNKKAIIKKIKPSAFDPNTISKSELLDMGFPFYATLNLIKYRDKGGSFKIKSDLQKIYGLDTIFEKLKPFILLPDTLFIEKLNTKEYANFNKHKNKTSNKSNYEHFKSEAKIQEILDINTATIEDFKELKGIGNVLSKRIIEYRQKLGGFVSIAQIGEVYNLHDSVFIANKPYFKIENDSIRRLKLNTIDFKSLLSHPLISYKQAQLILAYRKQHKTFKQIEEIQNIKAFDREFVDKILPYLSL